MKENIIQRRMIKKYEADGYYVIKLMQTNKNGIPDLLLIDNKSCITFVEIKSEKGKLSKIQEARIKELQVFGCKVKIINEKENESI